MNHWLIFWLFQSVNDNDRKYSELCTLVKKLKDLKPELKAGSTTEYKDFVIYPDENKNILKISDIVQSKSFSYYEYIGGMLSMYHLKSFK